MHTLLACGVGAGTAVGAVPMPVGNATELRKAQAARRKRQKDSYGLLTTHLLHKEHLQHITSNFFQNGRDTSTYSCTTMLNALTQATDQIRLDDMCQLRCGLLWVVSATFLLHHLPILHPRARRKALLASHIV